MNIKNKVYLAFYLILIETNLINIIQTSTALYTGIFVDINLFRFDWMTFLLILLVQLFFLVPFFIKEEPYKDTFIIGIICVIFIGLGSFIYDFIIIII